MKKHATDAQYKIAGVANNIKLLQSVVERCSILTRVKIPMKIYKIYNGNWVIFISRVIRGHFKSKKTSSEM